MDKNWVGDECIKVEKPEAACYLLTKESILNLNTVSGQYCL